MIGAGSKAAYLATPNHCPFCHGIRITADVIVPEENAANAKAEIECDRCHKRWKDVYKLVDVEEV